MVADSAAWLRGRRIDAGRACSTGHQHDATAGTGDRHDSELGQGRAGRAAGLALDGGVHDDVGSGHGDRCGAGLSVTAVARAKRIVWDMGDGHVVTCANPGTQYLESRGAGASPTCGYVYAASSAGQPGSEYVVTATTTWDVTWVGGGQSGDLTVTRTSTTRVRIGELQVLVS